MNEHEETISVKRRLAAFGYQQLESVDCFETPAATPSRGFIELLFAFAFKKGLPVSHFCIPCTI